MSRKPCSPFYWSDWLACKELRVCSLAARGLWMDMLCFMRQGRPIGHLTHENGTPITAEQLARLVGESPKTIRALLRELEDAGVPGKTDAGAYVNRRMIREESAYGRYRASQTEAGKRGAARRWGSATQPYDPPYENGKAGNGLPHPNPTVSASGHDAYHSVPSPRPPPRRGEERESEGEISPAVPASSAQAPTPSPLSHRRYERPRSGDWHPVSEIIAMAIERGRP